MFENTLKTFTLLAGPLHGDHRDVPGATLRTDEVPRNDELVAATAILRCVAGRHCEGGEPGGASRAATMTVFTIGSLVIGLVGLVGGAELLVKGAASIASRLGIAPVVIGLTVVAFGTSAPELAVSLSAALGGSADVAFGNVVGSNIANILLILGTSAIVGGLAVQQRIVRFDVPLLVVVSAVALVMSLDSRIGAP